MPIGVGIFLYWGVGIVEMYPIKRGAFSAHFELLGLVSSLWLPVTTHHMILLTLLLPAGGLVLSMGTLR